jgi:hypothetical protein
LAAVKAAAKATQRRGSAATRRRVGDFARRSPRAGHARRHLQHARPEPRDDGAARLDRRVGRRQADAVDLEPDDRLEQGDLAKTLGIPKEKVRLISPFIGGGFGGKLFPRRRDAGSAGCARGGRPVKVALRGR